MVIKTQTNISKQTDLEGGRLSERRGMMLGGERGSFLLLNLPLN
jgi:hypothetical protein